MDFALDEDQQAILFSVETLLQQHAGPARAIALAAKAEYDAALEAALAESGFLEVGLSDGAGPLEAALVVEAVARAAGTVSAGASLLVAPGVVGRALPGPVAVARAGEEAPVRFAAHARTLLEWDGDEARVVALAPGDALPVRSSFGYPMGRLRVPGDRRRESLGAGSGEKLARWWRLASAAEAVGTMGAALDVTLEYVKRRRQFGRAIGSFQALQHRLAECAVVVQGSRWLVLEAAFHGAPAEAAATAAAHAAEAAHQVFTETHQLTGAMGFTREHDLHVYSMRLQALRLEHGGPGEPQRAVSLARWVRGS